MRFHFVNCWLLAGAILMFESFSQGAERIRRVAVTNYTGYVIEADALTSAPGYDRDRIRAELIVESDNSAAATARTYTNVLSVRLIDSDGNPHPLILPGGTTNGTLTLSNVINAPAGSVRQTTNTVALQLASRLNSFSPYRLQLAVTSPFAPSGTTSNDIPRLYKHFTNVVNNDSSLNLLVEHRVDLNDTIAVATDAARNSFRADVPFTVYRFDGFSNAAPVTNIVALRFNYELRGLNSNSVIPLTTSQTTSFVPVPSFASSAPRVPAVVNGTNQLVLIPAPGVQLDPINEQYRLAVSVSFTNIPGGAPVAGTVESSAPTRLFHFSGRLLFGLIEAWFSELSSDPQIIPVVGSPTQFPALLHIINQSGTITGAPGRTFGSNERMGVYLQADGTSVFTTNNVSATVPPFTPNVRNVAVTAPPLDAGSINGVNYLRAGTTLDHEGGRADLAVVLPAGFGYTTVLSASRRFKGTAIFSNAPLVEALEPSGPLTLPGPLFASCDSHPLVFAAGALVWTPQAGAFSLALAVAGHVAINEFNRPNGERPGNYNHFRSISLSPTPDCHDQHQQWIRAPFHRSELRQ